MGIINRSRHSLQIRVLAGLLVALPGQVVLPSFYSQAHAQQLSSQEDGLLAKAVQEDSTFQESHKELRDLPTTVDTSTTPAEATEQGSPLRRRRAAGFVPTTLAAADSSGGTTSTYGSSSTTTMGDPNRALFQGLALFGAVAGGAGLGLGISNATEGGHHDRIIIISGSR